MRLLIQVAYLRAPGGAKISPYLILSFEIETTGDEMAKRLQATTTTERKLYGFRNKHLRMAIRKQVENISTPYGVSEDGVGFRHSRGTPIGRLAEEILFRRDSALADLEALKTIVRIAQYECSLCEEYLEEHEIEAGKNWDTCECVSSLQKSISLEEIRREVENSLREREEQIAEGGCRTCGHK